MIFTEADKKKLAELKEKERIAKQQERNEQKRVDRFCQKHFGMTAKQVAEKLKDSYWYDRYNETKSQIDRLLDALPHRPESFEAYVQYYEQKAANKQPDVHGSVSEEVKNVDA